MARPTHWIGTAYFSKAADFNVVFTDVELELDQRYLSLEKEILVTALEDWLGAELWLELMDANYA